MIAGSTGSGTGSTGSTGSDAKPKYSSEWINGKWFGKNGLQTRKYKGSWKKTKKGTRFVDTSGWYAKNRTLTINGKKYKFDKNGYVVKK